MKKKICIITWCDADNIVNYGQVLQGCAIAKTISEMKIGEVHLISYRERKFCEILEYYKLHYIPFSDFRNMYSNSRKLIKSVMKRNKIYFHQLFLLKSVERVIKDADFLVCGSDQIWHPMEYNPALLLGIGPENAKRISYAASQPMEKVYPEYRKIFQKMSFYLKKMDDISVREQGSVKLIEELSGKKVTAVVDPTLLVSKKEWEKLITPMDIRGKYILMYIPADMNHLAIDILRELKRKTGIHRVLCLAPRCERKISDVEIISDIGTGEFLYLIKNASIVCTSSFHGVIFSTIFEKEFWCFKWRATDRRADLRLNQVTEWAHLEHRLISKVQDINPDDEIDYKKVNQYMQKEIAESMKYLRKAFGKWV